MGYDNYTIKLWTDGGIVRPSPRTGRGLIGDQSLQYYFIVCGAGPRTDIKRWTDWESVPTGDVGPIPQMGLGSIPTFYGNYFVSL